MGLFSNYKPNVKVSTCLPLLSKTSTNYYGTNHVLLFSSIAGGIISNNCKLHMHLHFELLIPLL